MSYKYSAIHNTIINDGIVDDYDDNRILQDGERIRVGMMMLDHDSVQYAVAAGAAARQGTNDARRTSLDASALYDLDVSNRWRGGIAALQAGDVVTVNDQQCVVKSYVDDKLVLADANPGCVTLRDAQLTDARREAYDLYDSEIQDAWRR